MLSPDKHEHVSHEHRKEDAHNNPLANVLRFCNSLIRRKWTMLAWVVLTSGLGIAYFSLATREYESSAELLVLHTGEGNVDQTQQSQRMLQDQLPTYKKVIASDEVVKGALQRLPKKYQTPYLGMTKRGAINKLRAGLSVGSTRQTNLLQITYRSEDPEAAAVIITAVLDSYFQFMLETNKNSSQEMLGLLNRERNELQQQSQTKQNELLHLQAESDSILGTGENVLSVVNERVIELNKSLAEAQKRTIDARTYYVSVDQAIRNGEDLQHLLSQSNSAIANELMKMGMGVDPRDAYAYARLQQQLLQDESRLRDKLNGKLGPSHPEVLELQERIKTTNTWLASRSKQAIAGSSKLRKELGPRMLQMAKQRYDHAVLHEKDIYARFTKEKQYASVVNQRLVQLQMVERDLQRLQSDSNMNRERIKAVDLNQQSSLRTRITKHPEPNPSPVTPKLVLTAIMSLFSGLFFGAATVVILDLMDDRFHSPDDLKAQLGVPVLAMIRDLPPLNAETGLDAVFTHTKPNSVETEAFRTLRTAIEFAGESCQRISISSTEPSDGKTTVLSNTAVAFAQSGKRTLLIDGDMRRPGLTKLFDLKGQQGLSAILKDHRPPSESVTDNLFHTTHENLDIIAAGPRPVNPVELLTSDHFSDLIAWAEAEYDQILIDAPPSLAVTDPAVIGRVVDGVILTVRPDKNRRRMIIRAAETLTSFGANLIGVVVNRLETTNGEYGYGYGAGYGYGYGYGAESTETEEFGAHEDKKDIHTPIRKKFSRDNHSHKRAA